MESENKLTKKFEENYDKYSKIILFIPVLLLVISSIYLYNFSNQNGDLIKKDISLTGGTSVQVNSGTDITALKTALEEKFEDVSVRQISNILTGEQVAFVVESTSSSEEIISFLENYLGFELTSENSSVEFTGSSLSSSFYNQLKFAIILSFVLMALIVFLIFRTPVPSLAIIFAALADIIFTITTINILGIRVSTAGIVAILMLIGYSVDTDILLTTRVIKRKEGSINSRIFNSFKTGITMTLTSLIVAILALFLTASFSKVFSQIFTILTIGLLFDIGNTWLTNASLIKWHAEKREGKE